MCNNLTQKGKMSSNLSLELQSQLLDNKRQINVQELAQVGEQLAQQVMDNAFDGSEPLAAYVRFRAVAEHLLKAAIDKLKEPAAIYAHDNKVTNYAGVTLINRGGKEVMRVTVTPHYEELLMLNKQATDRLTAVKKAMDAEIEAAIEPIRKKYELLMAVSCDEVADTEAELEAYKQTLLKDSQVIDHYTPISLALKF